MHGGVQGELETAGVQGGDVPPVRLTTRLARRLCPCLLMQNGPLECKCRRNSQKFTEHPDLRSEFQISCAKVRFSPLMARSWWTDPDARCVGGDFLKGDGTGSFSIYGDKFPVSSFSSPSCHPSTVCPS